ncbi:HAMP domain-containing histidine kinase [Mesorhizobium sp. RP14(2022)]|uniref:histidine kinase n=1 Tax=Mesorhizobium liriopis TaxID=2953882 RepID=A0ABT1C9P6_9HYPH|nr:HAMP domain-containing sensor histidine kinase [Mesorhizobium liriopis]MCO6051502.1 HAMP domain-containing histidine kinase [Mesorhizobium liriopis]
MSEVSPREEPTRVSHDDRETASARTDTRSASVPLSHGLSLKLLLLTIIFVLLAEVLIFLPSIANFRLSWLEERLGTAAAVGIVLVEGDAGSLSRRAQDDVLGVIGVKAIAVRDQEESRLLVAPELPPTVDEHINLVETGPLSAMAGALDTLFFGGNRMLRVFGPVGDGPQEFELIVPDSKLRAAMLVYSRNIALLSALISIFTALLVYFAIDRVMIKPIRTMTRSMLDFAERPDDPSRIVTPDENRSDEIGVAERELAAMQDRLRLMLGEQKHLADLGLAVSKINHDMRNILSSAQLISDRLGRVQDPTVQSFAPKLLRALDRAVLYSEQVLSYGRAQEAPPARRRILLHSLVDEVFGSFAVDENAAHIEFHNEVPADFTVDADPEQLFRVLSNLSRNAVEAMAPGTAVGAGGDSVMSRLAIAATRQGRNVQLVISDTGPGLPPAARANLFSAFRGSARSGGTGLGLAIAQELVRAHGGRLELTESRGGHTVFTVEIPDQSLSRPQLLEPIRQYN